MSRKRGYVQGFFRQSGYLPKKVAGRDGAVGRFIFRIDFFATIAADTVIVQPVRILVNENVVGSAGTVNFRLFGFVLVIRGCGEHRFFARLGRGFVVIIRCGVALFGVIGNGNAGNSLARFFGKFFTDEFFRVGRDTERNADNRGNDESGDKDPAKRRKRRTRDCDYNKKQRGKSERNPESRLADKKPYSFEKVSEYKSQKFARFF